MQQPEAVVVEKPKPKISLNQQIEEVDRELHQRKTVYPRMVAKGSMRQSIADYQVQRMEAVKATLEFMWDNEATIREAIAAKKKRPAPADEGQGG